MIREIIVAFLAAATVATYVVIVNRMLRTDEHWSESDAMAGPEPAPAFSGFNPSPARA